jgi:ATP-binding cassette, subfamily B, multidrug efflux pump
MEFAPSVRFRSRPIRFTQIDMNTQQIPASSLSIGDASSSGIDVRDMPRVLARLVRLAGRYPARCIGAVIAALGAASANLVTPRLLGQVVDHAHRLLTDHGASAVATRHALLLNGLLIIAACAARGALTGLQGYLGENLAQRVGYDMRLQFFSKLQRLPFTFHDENHSGDMIARGMLDIEGIRAFLESGALRVVTLLMLVGVGSWRLFSDDAQLACLALAFVPFVIWRAARMGVLMRLSWQHLQQLMSDLTLAMEENLQGVRVVRACASQVFELAKFDRISDLALRLSNQRITVRMSSMAAMNFAYYVSMGLTLWSGGLRVHAGTLSVGTLTEFLTFIAILQQPLRQVGMIVNSSARASSSGIRLFQILETPESLQQADEAGDLAPGPVTLRFESVGFSFGGREVLHDISFEVAPGNILGIVGAPGSGKSTLAHLIPRFYEVSSGRISVNGIDIRQLSIPSLRRSAALVQQETFLFDATVRANIGYAEPDADMRHIVNAAKRGQIHSQIESMAYGYASQVGERGVALSGGQRQRMSIARALLRIPSILVLDDATSAVDALTERELIASLRDAGRQIATIVIANRTAAVAHADEIIVLDRGCIVERGTHAGLLEAGGSYARLWALQHGGEHATCDHGQQVTYTEDNATEVRA